MDHRRQELARLGAAVAIAAVLLAGCSQSQPEPNLPGQVGHLPKTINGIAVNADGTAVGAGPKTAMAKIPANMRSGQ